MAYLGIDIGTTGCKCAAFSASGQLLQKEYYEYERPQGSTEYDGEKIWQLIKQMIRTISGSISEPLVSACVTSQGEAFAAIDANGRALMPFLQNTDLRGAMYIPQIPEEIKQRIRQLDGLQPLARFPLSKMMYVKEQMPDVFEQLWKYMLFQDYIIYKLTGNAYTDYSIATRTLAFDIGSRRFDDAILSVAGIDSSKMPEPVPTGYCCGYVSPALAAELGLGPQVRVLSGGHDAVPEALASGLVRPGLASLGCGTAEGICCLVQQDRVDLEQLVQDNISREPFPVSGCYSLNGFSANSGSVVKWYRDNFRDLFSKESENLYALMDKSMPTEPTRLLVVPHFVGSSTPDFNTAARGTITGFSLSTTPLDIYRALLEGTAYEIKFILEKMESACGNHIDELLTSGGGARSPQWLQIKADILGKTIVPLETTDTTLAGCAMICAVEDGAYIDLEAAAQAFVHKKAPLHPIPENVIYYREMYDKYVVMRGQAMSLWS